MMPHHRSPATGYTRYSETVACYAVECDHAKQGWQPCKRAQLARTRRPRIGDLTDQGFPCPHFVSVKSEEQP